MLKGYPQHTTTAIDAGEIRLIQAYLEAIGQFVAPNGKRSINGITGNLDTRTSNACEHFMQANNGHCNLTTQQQVNGVIATLRRAHNATLTTDGVDDSLAARTALTRAFEGSVARQRYPELAGIHPQMRFPLALALDELSRRGVQISIREGYRSPAQQEAEVMEGNSAAVPSRSFHGYGLAVDIIPRGLNTDATFNPRTPQWQTTIAVMQRYGFYSLYANQGWDLPHFELPAKTNEMIRWPNGRDGYKDIPNHEIPAAWSAANAQALSRARPPNRPPHTR